MKNLNIKTSFILVLLLVNTTLGFCQEKTKKQLKEEHKLEKQRQIDSLVNSRGFVFVGAFAYPQGYKSVNLATNPNFVKFFPDSVSSDMPYYGRAYNVSYGGDGGLKFEGKAEKYTLKKEKKNYQINCSVKGEHDVFQIFLSISFSGSATLSINSNNRNSISYSGDISSIEKQK